jgi:gluconolactonase
MADGAARDVSELRVLASGLDHPEGVALGPDGSLYAGGEAGQIYGISPNGRTEQVADTGGSVQGIAVDGRGAVYACDVGLAAVVRLDAAGRIERWCESAGGTPLIAPNWGAFAPDGSLWFSDSGTERVGACDGRLIRVPPGGGDGEPVDVGPLDFPNGLAVGEDGTVFLLESFAPRLSALRRAGIETVAELPGVVPDGLALTADGNFVVSCYYPFRILLVSRSGRDVSVLIDDEQGIHIPMPTNVAFFGDGLRSLAIACLGGSTICALDATGFAGAPLHRPITDR